MSNITKFWGQKTKAEKYLEFVNDWLTIDAIADNYGMTNADMINLLNEGKIEHLENICEERKAKLETYKKDYDSMVAEVARLSGENSKMREALCNLIKVAEVSTADIVAFENADILDNCIDKANALISK